MSTLMISLIGVSTGLFYKFFYDYDIL